MKSLKAFIIALLTVSVILCGFIWFLDQKLFYICGAVLSIIIICTIYRAKHIDKDIYRMFRRLAGRLTSSDKTAIESFPMPVIVCSIEEKILWYNELFRSDIVLGNDCYGKNFYALYGIKLGSICRPKGLEICYNNQYYHAFARLDQDEYTIYLKDITDYKNHSISYANTRPSVMLIVIDNYHELMQNSRESEKSQVLGEIDRILEDFIGETTTFISRLDRDRFVVVVEEQHLRKFIEKKFNVLDRARTIVTADKMPVTLSIGVGRFGKTLAESETYARQALDLSLGRGGDQAAVKTDIGFDFYGGISKGVEKRTKVKTRIIATAITELVDTSDLVIVMGHRFSDLDSLGSSIGLAQALRSMGKNAVVAVSCEKSLAGVLVQRMATQGVTNLFIEPASALEMITKKTLLIILDTHNPNFLESKEIYDACKSIVVVDHHRKMVNHIDNAVIFYHEPYASSASEMVTELVQYFGDHCKITSAEAEALLAGIMLDTRNFTIRTGVRTFEAAAFLRRAGADTVEVRKLFSSSMDSYQRKTRLVSSAEIYKNCAIASSDFQSEDLRIVAPQAADELLSISGVAASFVLYEIGNNVSFSARSMGELNVQIIMESLGGGGHHTMAGAQITDISIDGARQLLLEAIDKVKSI